MMAPFLMPGHIADLHIRQWRIAENAKWPGEPGHFKM